MKHVKRIFVLLIFVVMLATMLLPSALALGRRNLGAPTPNLPLRARVTLSQPTSNLNVREGPGTNHTVLGTVPHGRYITVIGNAGNGWMRVRFNDTTRFGYVDSSLIWMPSTWDDRRVFMVVVTPGSGLNFRESAPSGSVLAVAPNGERVPQNLLTITQGFRSVVYRGLGTGWMHQDHLGTPPPN